MARRCDSFQLSPALNTWARFAFNLPYSGPLVLLLHLLHGPAALPGAFLLGCLATAVTQLLGNVALIAAFRRATFAQSIVLHKLEVAFAASPPFRASTPEERARTVREINESGARILFVGLGTPKQDLWMAEHQGQIRAAMVGVGAAFDFIAGRKAQAPRWMQGAGLEWLFRLVHEPGRLWKRYMVQNPRFLSLFGAQLARERLRATAI